MSDYKVFFLIVAAGKGRRMDTGIKKQYLVLNDRPILSHTLSKFLYYQKPHEIILVVPEDDIDYCRKNILTHVNLDKSKNIHMIQGGSERQESVFNGIRKAQTLSRNPDNDLLLIHDGVRPLINKDLIDSCIKGALQYKACVPALKAVDTIKRVKENIVENTLERDTLYHIQTPQAFLLKTIVNAMRHALKNDFFGTDDASLVEFSGQDVGVIKGLRRNIKITTKEDLKFAKAWLSYK